MSSIQERLQLKRVPLDTWTIREKLCLASAVMRSEDQNWMSVSRALKAIGDPNRPADWYSQKSCAAQYGALLENVETPKRKKRNGSEGAVETPQQSILNKLTQERILEINKEIADINTQFSSVQSEITELRNPDTPEGRVKELWGSIETSKRAREKEQAKRLIWLREREERHARAERNWRPSAAPATPSSPVAAGPAPQPSSPLLSSLLKSSPVVTTPQHIPHPATVVETISPSAGAPTLSMLLDKRTPTQENEHAAIEHIKSEIVQLAKQLKASSSNAQPLPVVPAVTAAPSLSTDKIEIDDIEIKAEDVYAFSDIDIEIPPVSSIHSKAQISRNAEKLSLLGNKKKDETPVAVPEAVQPKSLPEQPEVSQPPPKPEAVPPVEESVPVVEPVQVPVQKKEPEPAEPSAVREEVKLPEETPVKISFPEVKFPTPEIKVIAAEEPKAKEVKLPDVLPEVAEPETEEKEEETEEERRSEGAEGDQTVEKTAAPEAPETVPEEIPQEDPPLPEVPTEDIDKAAEEENVPEENQEEPEPETEPEVPTPVPEVVEGTGTEVQENVPAQTEVQPEETVAKIEDDSFIKQENQEDAEESMTLQAVKEVIMESQSQPILLSDVKKEEESTSEDIPQDTDDDTPMEMIREEEKDGKKKRDYSRKRKYESRTWSGSESAPESPVSEMDKDHKLWKKSIMLVHNRLCTHRYASLFLRPITNDQAPNYDRIVKRPMDLNTIKKHIDTGIIRTTKEFHRALLLMLSNALFYNSVTHDVHHMAREMHKETVNQLEMLLQAQAHAELPTSTQRSNKRRSIAVPPAKRRREH